MPNSNDVLDEIHSSENAHDLIRRKYLRELSAQTDRNVIIYYSGWLQKGHLVNNGVPGFDVNDSDKTGFMTCIHGMDRTKGLDLLLHTPGGDVAATESLVDYLRAMFKGDVRAIIPQLAMSAGTMMALSCKEIVMGTHSSLGPIDPQLGGRFPAHGIVEEFETAKREVMLDPSTIPIWQPIIGKYPPAMVGEAQKAIDWSNDMVSDWLLTGMLKNDPNAPAKVVQIVKDLGDHATTLSHNRHVSADKALAMGLNIMKLESNQALQEAVLTVHHATMATFNSTPAIKIIENQDGVAHVLSVATA